jgi:hypothetical protein
MKKINIFLIKYGLYIPASFCGVIAILSVIVIYPLFRLFNPKFVLPPDKAGIDVTPFSKWFWIKFTTYNDFVRKN